MHLALWMLPVSADREQALDALFAGRPEVLSVEDVADVLNVTRTNVYAWLRDGVIPGYKLGTTWRVVRDELKATMATGANARRTRTTTTRDEESEER